MTDPVPSKGTTAIPDAAVYHVCNYLMEDKCRRCAPRVDTPYGPGESGCFAVAKEQIEVVLIALRTASQ